MRQRRDVTFILIKKMKVHILNALIELQKKLDRYVKLL